MDRRAKIVATLGPACSDSETLQRLVRAGMDAARINFSHGDAEGHRRVVTRLRRVAGRAGRPIAILGDLQGPRFRVGRLPAGGIELEEQTRVVLVAGRKHSRDGEVPVNPVRLARDVRAGDRILLDDGNLELRVTSVRGRKISCTVVRGGRLTDHKGINVPGRRISAPSLTAKDRRDIRLAVDLDLDWLAVSFVRSVRDVRAAQRALRALGRPMPVMAKIERPEALADLDAILAAADGVLVARGDLGVEIPPERVPTVQKRIIAAANAAGKTVMTATQMLESMRHSPRPTRAEAADVANAVLDGSDSLLLTAETAAGGYPVEAVAMMARIVEEAERSARVHRAGPTDGRLPVPAAVCHAAGRLAQEVQARYLVVFTTSGSTAATASRFRPETPMLVFSPDERRCRELALWWGLRRFVLGVESSTDALIAALDADLLRRRLARAGDRMVVVMGAPVGVPGTTNLIKVHRLGEGRFPA